ncbi:histone-lysine N-methyltransferase SETMAR [Trichonephila clavipes]|nr:histone-lysine N-methyltransferase SETMAR [Trichonephila clavipes]
MTRYATIGGKPFLLTSQNNNDVFLFGVNGIIRKSGETLCSVYSMGIMQRFSNGENASQVAEISNGIYGTNTVTANYVQFWFRRFRSGIFDVKDAPRTGRPVDENVDKITEIIEVDQLVSNRSFAQGLKIDHKTVLSHLRKVEFKKKLHIWVPHQLTLKSMVDRISICEALDNRNEIDPFLKQMVTGDKKWITYYNIIRKRSWSKCGEQLKQWPNLD